MVSLRRRRLLGLPCGPNGYVTPLPFLTVEDMMTGIPKQNANSAHEKSMPVDTLNPPKDEKTPTKVGSSSPSDSVCVTPEEQQNQSVSDQPIKRRKRHRRKQVQNQELCLMRGVYFKNMKWQAAIKVDKKQIHLGTVSSKEEAARLYDRAAFMCGREPNFELSEEEKQELKKFSWDDFLSFTRRAITNKKSKRRIDLGSEKSSDPLTQSGIQDMSGSEEVGLDSSSA